MRGAWSLALLGAVGCASVLGIPDKSPSFCARPENQGHAWCEDFDVGDATTRWTYAVQTGGTLQIAPSDDSPPNLVDMATPVPPSGDALAGFTKEFDEATFTGLHIEADVRFVTPNGGSITAQGGFLLVVDKAGGCVGVAITPGGVGAAVAPDARSCSGLTSGLDSGGGGGGPPQQFPITGLPELNTWLHVKAIVTPNPDGSGTMTLEFRGQPAASSPVPLPPNTLVPSGAPLVGFAADAHGGTGSVEVQMDNITIDLTP
ncbi:MAG TPA: hypothetical protein VIF15_08670 [Polyangiaceae bacterium]|jgi:hypothetical protein